MAWAATDRDDAPKLIRPADITAEIRGGDNATRQINSIIPPGFACRRLVLVEVYTDDHSTGTRKTTSTARITYVAIDAKGRPTPVPALRLTSDEERRRFEEARRRRETESRA